MKVKWSLVLVIVLGVFAALFAAVLMTTVRTNAMATVVKITDPKVTVLVAARDFVAHEVIDKDSITSQEVSKNQAPAGYFSEPLQLIGRRFSVSVIQGQPVTRAVLASNGIGATLADKLESGTRAVTLSLPNYSALEGLLYPGCKVDVLAAFALGVEERARSKGTAVSTTLLQNIEVLAVNHFTIVSAIKDESEEAVSATSKGASSGGRRSLLVTLLVTTKQAEALQLAGMHGHISLALRNPLDEIPLDNDVTMLSQGRLASVAAIMEPIVGGLNDDGSKALPSPPPERDSSGAETAEAEQAEAPPRAVKLSEIVPSESWDIEIIRGLRVEKKSFFQPVED